MKPAGGAFQSRRSISNHSIGLPPSSDQGVATASTQDAATDVFIALITATTVRITNISRNVSQMHTRRRWWFSLLLTALSSVSRKHPEDWVRQRERHTFSSGIGIRWQESSMHPGILSRPGHSGVKPLRDSPNFCKPRSGVASLISTQQMHTPCTGEFRTRHFAMRRAEIHPTQ